MSEKLNILKERFILAATKFAQIIHPVYFMTSHTVLTDRGYKIPSENELEKIIVRLTHGLKENTISASTAGIQLEVEKDETGDILDGSIGYVQPLSELLGEV